MAFVHSLSQSLSHSANTMRVYLILGTVAGAEENRRDMLSLKGRARVHGDQTSIWRALFFCKTTLNCIHKIKLKASEGACASDGSRDLNSLVSGKFTTGTYCYGF